MRARENDIRTARTGTAKLIHLRATVNTARTTRVATTVLGSRLLDTVTTPENIKREKKTAITISPNLPAP